MRRVTLAETASFDEPSVTYWKHVIQKIAQAMGSTSTCPTAQKLKPNPQETDGVDPVLQTPPQETKAHYEVPHQRFYTF